MEKEKGEWIGINPKNGLIPQTFLAGINAGIKPDACGQSVFFPSALTFAHRAFATARNLAFWAADILRFGFRGVALLGEAFFAFIFAQRALAAAAIRARPAADMPDRRFTAERALPPNNFPSSASSSAIRLLRSIARFNCSTEGNEFAISRRNW